jgi:small subunit ribosomal protein S27e
MAGDFLKVKCPNCKNDEQIIFGRCASNVACVICGQVLAKSTGGKAEMKCKVLEVFPARKRE